MPNTCIIIPCYNESSRLQLSDFEEFILKNQEIYFCFVNDGSKDNTLTILEKLKKKAPDSVKIVHLIKNSGKAEAVRQGMLEAPKWKSFDFIGFLDADLSTPLSEIHFFIEKLNQGYRIVLGSRIKRLGAVIKRNTLRHYIGRIFATFASITMQLEVYDSQCGAKLFDSKITQNLFQEPFISKWIFDIEILIRARKSLKENFFEKTYELPVSQWIGKDDSRIKVHSLFRIPLDLIRIKLKYL